MERGKLKIFFGYCAGAGKTYAMLKAAQEAKKQGVNVVIGYLEPHDRPDTAAMAEGLDSLPLKVVSYKGITLKEFDVDAAIKARPELILVDELAHTNAPGSKNRKRYLDVEELINNGIDVWTTVNVQHIESLHDVVGGATSVDVSERIPDEIFDYADEVVLIDVEPETLIERMKEGKIYKPAQARTALNNFFNGDNLSALRELFLRRGADRIEKQTYNGEQKTGVLALVSPSPSSEKNIRVAARLAEAYHCKFSAIYVETDGDLSDEAAANLKKHMNLVRDLGGEMVVKYGEDVVETVASYVRIAGVTNLVLGKTWQSIGKKVSLEDKFIARLNDLEIIIVPDNAHAVRRKNPIKTLLSQIFTPKRLLKKYKTANATLDVIQLVCRAAIENKGHSEIARVLSNAFSRSCAVFGKERRIFPFENEDVGFFSDKNETAVAEWCAKNGKSAGRGTDTLREAKAIYFPVRTAERTYVVAFSCVKSKMTVTEKLVFSQIQTVLQIVL